MLSTKGRQVRAFVTSLMCLVVCRDSRYARALHYHQRNTKHVACTDSVSSVLGTHISRELHIFLQDSFEGIVASTYVASMFKCSKVVFHYRKLALARAHVFFPMQPFHADWWAKKVDEKEGSSAVAMTKSRHWVTADQPDEVNRRLDAFLGQK